MNNKPTPKSSPKPIILLPLRLEIRYINKSDSGDKTERAFYSYEDRNDGTGKKPGFRKDKSEKKELKLAGTQEIWIRWYPDDCQIFPPISKISADEIAAYNTYIIPTEKPADAWAKLVSEVGLQRARYIVDNKGEDPDFVKDDFKKQKDLPEESLQQFMAVGAKLKALPKKVKLYTIHENRETLKRKVIQLTNEEDVKKIKNITFSTNDIPSSRWIADFDEAVEKGMGVRITNKKKCQQVKNADWLVAVGHKNNGEKILQELLLRHKALGEFNILRQGTPTNNTEDCKTEYMADESGTSKEKEIFDPTASSSENTLSNKKLLMTYLDLSDEKIFSGIKNSSLDDQQVSRAMRNLLFKPCTYDYRRRFLNSSKNNDKAFPYLVEHFKSYVIGGGLFPAIQIGDNPYGILPVTILADWKSIASDNEKNILETTIAEKCKSLKKIYMRFAQSVPHIDLADKEQDIFNTLEHILQFNPVSHRVDIQVFKKMIDFNADPHKLGCPLVTKGNTEKEKCDYVIGCLKHLIQDITERNGSESVDSWPNLTNEVSDIPLFERLLKFHIYLLVQMKTSPSHLVEPITVLYNLLKAEELSVTSLETMFLEVLDCLSYRLDAWISSLAYLRLSEINEKGVKPSEEASPGIGVYGWLEKPSAEGLMEESKGYLQAPSMDQAITGAILRSAALSDKNDKDSPFQINLSSERVKMAIWFVQGLQSGYTSAELLGYQVERKLHDRELDKYLLDLRKTYPLSNQEGTEIFKNSRVIDGEKFLTGGKDKKAIKRKDRKAIEEIRSEVRQIRDAVADLHIAETLYQTVRGNTARTAAWLEAIEGNVLPPEPEVMKTPRTGHPQIQRVVWPLNLAKFNQSEVKNPLIIAEPAIAEFCASRLGGFTMAKFTVTVVLREKKGSSLFSMDDILKWDDILKSLKEHRSPDKKRIWEFLDDKSKKIIEAWKQGESLDKNSKQLLINVLNKIVKNRDFYSKEAFNKIELTEEAKGLCNKGLMNLSENEIQRFNRLLFESVYPQKIAKSQKKEESHTFRILPKDDLGMDPIDLVVRGLPDLEKRTRIWLWWKLIQDRLTVEDFEDPNLMPKLIGERIILKDERYCYYFGENIESENQLREKLSQANIANGEIEKVIAIWQKVQGWKFVALEDFRDANLVLKLLEKRIIIKKEEYCYIYFDKNIESEDQLREKLDLTNISDEETEKVVAIWQKIQSWKFLDHEFLASPTVAELDSRTTINFDNTYYENEATKLEPHIKKAEYIHLFLKSVQPLSVEDILETTDMGLEKVIQQKTDICEHLNQRFIALRDFLEKDLQVLKNIRNSLNNNTSNKQNNVALQNQLLNICRYGLPDVLTFIPIITSEEDKKEVIEMADLLLKKMEAVKAELDKGIKPELVINAVKAKIKIDDDGKIKKLMDDNKWEEIEDGNVKVLAIDKLIKETIVMLKKRTAGDAMFVFPPFNLEETLSISKTEKNHEDMTTVMTEDYSKVRKNIELLMKRILPKKMKVISNIGIQKSKEEAITQAELPDGVLVDDVCPEDVIKPADWSQSSVDLHYVIPQEGLTVQRHKLTVGFKVDEWTDFIPNTKETTGLSFQYKTPQAEAPQAILLAVPPSSEPGVWHDDELVDIIADTIDLMRIRSVSSEKVAGSVLGNLLPCLFFEYADKHKCRFPSPERTTERKLYDGIIKGGWFFQLKKGR